MLEISHFLLFSYFHIHIQFKEFRSVGIMKRKHVASTFEGTSNSDSYIFQNFRKDACSFFAFFFCASLCFSHLYLMMCPITPPQIPLISNLGVFLHGFLLFFHPLWYFFSLRMFLGSSSKFSKLSFTNSYIFPVISNLGYSQHFQ